MTQPIITFHDFGVHYGTQIALTHVTTAIEPHKITAIIGPSGCGKSTFLKSINRMIECEEGATLSGSIHLEDKDIMGLDPEALRKRIGMVFQTPTPFPFSIYKNLTFAPRYHGNVSKTELDTMVRNALVTTGLYDEVKDDLNKSALKLSGGQQQRLCIARALTAEPEILLLDEPCSALDVKSTSIIENLLLSLKEHYTIVIVTHNLHQAKRIADNCLFLLNGELIEEGPASELFGNPQQSATQDYLQGVFS